jgi:hypothetical protein
MAGRVSDQCFSPIFSGKLVEEVLRTAGSWLKRIREEGLESPLIIGFD